MSPKRFVLLPMVAWIATCPGPSHAGSAAAPVETGAPCALAASDAALFRADEATTAATSAPAETSAVATDSTRSEPRRARPALPRRVGNTAVALLSDFWVVVSSPARIDRHGAVRLGIAAAATGLAYAYDEELLDAWKRHQNEPFWNALQETGNAIEPVGWMQHTLPWYAGAAALGYVLDVRPVREMSMQIIESHLISSAVRNGVKHFLGRPRPVEGKGPRYFAYEGGNSFPSGHTSIAFELATIASHHARSKPVTVLAYAAAATMALERLHSDSHWPSDVLLSAFSGTWIARTVIRRHEERASRMTPRLGFENGRMRIGVEAGF